MAELAREFPALDTTELVERLLSVGVVVTHPARPRESTPGLATTYDFAIDEARNVRTAVISDDDQLRERVEVTLATLPDMEVGSDAADVSIIIASRPAELARLSSEAWKGGFVHLPLRQGNGRILTVGPLAIPPLTACLDCVLLREGGTTQWANEHWELAHSERSTLDWASGDPELATHLAGRMVHRALVDRDDDAIGHVSVLNSIDLTLYTSRVWSVPRCPTCSVIETYSTAYPWLRP
ncbi:hypothetical protein GCM10009820_08770 [Leifsonia soli]